MKSWFMASMMAATALLTCAAAQAEIAVVVNRDHPLASMTVEQVASIYLGKDFHFQPIDLPESESLHHWFYFKVTGRDAAQIQMGRARQLATVRPPKLVSNSAEAVRRVAANKNAIAYVDQRAVDSSVKVILTIPSPLLLDHLQAHD